MTTIWPTDQRQADLMVASGCEPVWIDPPVVHVCNEPGIDHDELIDFHATLSDDMAFFEALSSL